jgi:hypothetical protein
MRRIFGPKGEEITRKERKLQKDELHGFCTTINLIRLIKSRRIRWAGCACRV